MKTTKRERIARFYSDMANLGFTYSESNTLRRIEMTLSSWAVRECGDGSDWGIERDEDTGKPYNVYHGPGKPRRYPIPDRERGALKRADAILAARNARELATVDPAFPATVAEKTLVPYHQSDPRGCALYLVRKSDIPEGRSVDEFYTRGFPVCY